MASEPKVVKLDFELLREQLDAMMRLLGETKSLSITIKKNGNLLLFVGSRQIEIDYETQGVLSIVPEFADERTEQIIEHWRKTCKLGKPY